MAGYFINNFIVDKDWALFDKHKNIKNLNQTLTDLRKKYPEIQTKSLQEIIDKYNNKMSSLEQNVTNKNISSPRNLKAGFNPGISSGPLSRHVDYHLHRKKVRRALRRDGRFSV